MDIILDHQEKENFLSKMGYTFHEAAERFHYHEYHDKITEYEKIVLHAYKDGKRIPYIFSDKNGLTKHQQFNKIFEREFSKKILQLINS